MENAELQEYVMTRLKRKVNRNANFNTIHSDRSIPQWPDELEKQRDVPIFCAEPHKPWQRGCNEHAKGLLRFFFPKGSDFSRDHAR